MKNFKPGQKVVFKWIDCVNPDFNYPKDNETITIKGRSIKYSNCWYIEEYPTGKFGVRQSFTECCLFPLEELGISLTMHRAELSQLRPKEVLEETIKNNLMQWQ